MTTASVVGLIHGLPLLAQMQVSPSIFHSTLFQLPPPFNMIVLVVALGCLAGMVKAVAKQIRIYADHEADRRLKRDMIDSGLSVEEADRIARLEVTHDYVRSA